jgi:hypothetical protein
MIYAHRVKLQELARGLWRWTARHPDWEPPEQEDDPDDWAPDVGCVAYESADTFVLIDPLVVDGDYEQLDRLAGSKPRVSILTTVKWHDRSGTELTKRYGASNMPPGDVLPIELPGAGETLFWIPEHRALVPGDRILGDRPPGLRMCPESWLRHLGGYTRADLREALRERVLDLPVDLVLVSHGEPVLSDGRAELERALS